MSQNKGVSPAPQRQLASLAKPLADKDVALHDYFNVLLQGTTKSGPSAVGSVINAQCTSSRFGASEVPCTPRARSVESDSDKPSLDDDALSGDGEDYYVEDAPDWARRPLQALEFTIAKLKLAIPLTHLCGTLDWQLAELISMPSHSKHFIGVLSNHGIHSKIVDVSNILVPKRYQHKVESWKTRTTRVVLIGDSAWGLVCDEILGVVTLDPREVNWRSDRTQRAWLVGTLIGKMSAIIDGNEFATTLLQDALPKGTLERAVQDEEHPPKVL